VRRFDPARAAAVGIASAAALLVGGGLVLGVLGALDSTGWVVLVLVLAEAALVLVLRDRSPHARPALVAIVALSLAVGAVALSRASARDEERRTRFTQFWLVQPGSDGRTEIGVRNEERGRALFRVTLYGPASRKGGPVVDTTVALEPGRTWSRVVTLPATALPERVNAELYRGTGREPYRSAHVWTSPGR
jgi:hypothetical protein